MDHGHEIRVKANELRAAVCAGLGLDPASLIRCDELTGPVLDSLSLFQSAVEPESPNLHGSLAVIEDDVVFYRDDLEGGFRHYCIAHETGHHVLHTFKSACSRDDIDDIETDEEVPTAKGKVIGYGPYERAEREANLFALELLLPCSAIRRAFAEEGLTADEIAGTTGMPVSYVMRQIARAVLIPFEPETGDGRPKTGDRESETGHESTSDESRVAGFSLDPSQRRAVETKECPVLISAGPGTGKTETLIRRIVHLLNTGADPRRILALTFSNKAAQEMRERIAEARPSDAAKIRIMTFHSFGLDLLTRYWKEAGTDKDPRLLDQIDALLMLENHLSELNLEHYLALYDPMRDLPDVLSAISRAKDELCGPEQYLKFASEMRTAAEDDDETLKADKAIETARVYEVYQRLMDENRFLDFGDLIMKPVRLLESSAEVRDEVAGSYDHVLVDEFQDVNRASGVLLRLIAGEGKGLWAVGDLRQSIYRWRGASPQNIRSFHDEYPGAKTLSLETNYRSVSPIVKTFGEFGRGMIAREPFNEWEAHRGEGEEDAITLEVADRFATEAGSVAERIAADKKNGTAYKDQAVICRTHGQLAALSSELTGKGIPVFYLGQLFERPEVRDLLSLLDLVSSKDGHALVRVGAFNEYGLSKDEIFRILILNNDRQTGVLGLEADDEALEISGEARKRFAKLRQHLDRERTASAYRFLSNYLFNRSRYLAPLLVGGSVTDKQRLIAIYQLLGFASSMESRFAALEDPVAGFLQYIKRLVLFSEQKNLAEIPAAASDLDAVRLLTVHGAKGLEFGSVCLPYLAAGKFPASYRGEKCPTPPGLRGDPKEDHAEEEECLFFVAVSRARDRLHLSRTINYTENRTSKPSPFLDAIENVLPEERVLAASEGPPPQQQLPPEAYTRTEFYSAELDRYMDCPRQYYYRHEAGLKASDNRTAYQKLHGVVFDTLRQVRDSSLEMPELEAFARETMDRLWDEAELEEHAYGELYRAKAEELLDKLIERFGGSESASEQITVSVPLSNGIVKVSSDSVEKTGPEGSEQVVSRKVKTGKTPKDVKIDNADALLLEGLRREFPGADVSVRKVFLSDDNEHEQEISDRVVKNRLAKYEEAIDGVNRGEFDPDPDDRKCPTCSYYFMCQESGKR